jgi:signal transduction histidine kinase
LTGLTFELAHGDELIVWPELLDMVERGDAAFVTELIRTEARIGRYIWLDTMLASEFLTLVSEEKKRLVRLNEVMNFRIGVVRNTAQTEAFMRWFPDHEHVVEYDSTQDALLGIRSGDVDLVMSSTANLFVMTNYLELTGFKANIVFTDTLQESTIGLNINETILRNIIDKALRFVDISPITDEWRNRTFDYRHQLLEAQRPLLFGAIILSVIVLVLLLFLWRRSKGEEKKLEVLVSERTAELESKQHDMEILMKAAEMASRAKSDFLAMLSHEIRTPMNSIMGFAELAHDSNSLPLTKEYLTKVSDGTKWLMRIVNDIHDISTIEAGKLTITSEPFHLHEVISRCQPVILPAVRQKMLDLRLNSEPVNDRM